MSITRARARIENIHIPSTCSTPPGARRRKRVQQPLSTTSDAHSQTLSCNVPGVHPPSLVVTQDQNNNTGISLTAEPAQGSTTPNDNSTATGSVASNFSDKSSSHVFNFLLYEHLIERMNSRPRIKIYCIFNDIRSLFGVDIKIKFEKLAHLLKQHTTASSNLTFLLECREKDLLPKHILHSLKSISFHSSFANRKYRQLCTHSKRRILGLEIADLNIHKKFLDKNISLLSVALNSSTHPTIVNSFLRYFEQTLAHTKTRIVTSHKKKTISLTNSDPALPYTNSHQSVVSTREFPIVPNSEIENIKRKWLVNLTNIVIPQYAIDILSLGEKFNFSIDFGTKDAVEFFKRLETGIYFNKNISNKTREETLKIIDSHIRNKPHINYIDKIINQKLVQTKQFLKNTDGLFLTKADKGNVTVAVDRDVYTEKVESALQDPKYYRPLKSNPINSVKRRMQKLISTWERRGVFECDDSFRNINTNLDNTLIPKAYGLIKIHKQNFPIRIIVSALNSPTYGFDKCISQLFNNHFPLPKSNLKNSQILKESLEDFPIPSDYRLVSFDVVSLFSNIPKELILEAIGHKWKYLNNKINLSKSEFLEGIETLLDCTYLQFNNKFYKQIMGAPMGFCTSPWFADIALELLECHCLNTLNNCILRYHRYVDDCFLVIQKDNINLALSTFNEYNPNLQFTSEIEKNKKISFLDLEIHRLDNSPVRTNWYRKETASGRYINFFSHHPTSQKIAIIYNLIDKCILLSHPSFHRDNIKTAKQFLLANDYPTAFIDKYVNKRLASINNRRNSVPNASNNNGSQNQHAPSRGGFMVLPYNKFINNKITHTLRNLDLNTVNTCSNKLNHMIKLGKDKLEKKDTHNIVYKIDCKDCKATYVGTTSRHLKKRQYEHEYAVKKRDEKSPLALHNMETGHIFDFENMKILDRENVNYTRKFSEMLHIHLHDNTINRMYDTSNLKTDYKNSIDLLKKHNRKNNSKPDTPSQL